MSAGAAMQADHRECVLHALLAAKMLLMFDLPKALEAIEHAHAVGPIIDPTLYRAKSKAMDEDAEILRAAMPLWRKARELAGRLEVLP